MRGRFGQWQAAQLLLGKLHYYKKIPTSRIGLKKWGTRSFLVRRLPVLRFSSR